MNRRELDLVLVTLCSLVLLLIVVAIPSLEPLRIILGLPFVLFLPGYALMAALFPRQDDVDAIERIALSLGLSIAVVPLIGLALNYSPWGVGFDPLLLASALFIVSTAAVALYRRRTLAPEEAFTVSLDAPLRWWSRAGGMDRVAVGALLLVASGLGLAAFYVATSQGNAESFTEFYLLGADGRAADYPNQVRLGEPAAVTLGMVSHEAVASVYRVEVRMNGAMMEVFDDVTLSNSEQWQSNVALVASRPGEDQMVEFLLYKDGSTEPYRRLHLWLDVKPPIPDATGLRSVPSAAPAQTMGDLPATV